MIKRFANARDAVVTDAIEGLLAAQAEGGLTRLDGFPDIKVVLRGDWDRQSVALVSGGGSGHEPAHAGYVGQGMLTAAVCGQIFASPSVDAVLAAILAVTGEPGCLLIVKNYTGDRLNFGLAAERARAMGKAVEIVIVGDDVALPDNPQPRGIAGTVFVHKLAGAAAAEGRDLDAVTKVARDAAASIRSLGLALTSCTPFAAEAEQRIPDDQVELGLGIHGEPGAEHRPMGSADELMAVVADRLLETAPDTSARLAVMINDLGGVPPIELQILAKSFRQTGLRARTDYLVGPGPFMTSLDMAGFSLSLLSLDEARLKLLLASTSAPAWQPARKLVEYRPLALPPVEEDGQAAASGEPATRATIEAVLELLEEIESEINALDGKVGDGDTGSTFAHAARAVRQRLDTLPLAEPAELMAALAQILQRSAGGSAGVLLAIMFAAGAAGFRESGRWAQALQAGLERMEEHGGARPGDRTMIDALDPAFRALAEGGDLKQAAAAAREGADATARMQRAGAGRSAYVGADALGGHVDPGAEVAARIFERLAAR